MAQIAVGNLTVELDDEGFLENPLEWTEDVARVLATTEKVGELTEEHWLMINYLRDYYEEYWVVPMVRKIVKDTGFNRQKINDLFPIDPRKGACKIAGLPKPTGCM